MTKLTIGDLKLEEKDFTETEQMQWPRALIKLLGHLGACCFVLNNDKTFTPTPALLEICTIVERSFGAPGAALKERATELAKAVKVAYDKNVDLQRKLEEHGNKTFFKLLP